jgi:hypothetical protein
MVGPVSANMSLAEIVIATQGLEMHGVLSPSFNSMRQFLLTGYISV